MGQCPPTKWCKGVWTTCWSGFIEKIRSRHHFYTTETKQIALLNRRVFFSHVMKMNIAGKTGETISFEKKTIQWLQPAGGRRVRRNKFLRLCRTPHVCVGTLVLVTFLQCGLSVWHYSQPVPATFQENGWEGVEEVRRSWRAAFQQVYFELYPLVN